MNAVLPCRIITVVTFLGDRSHAFVRSFLRAVDDEKNGRGPGPYRLDCLFYTGHMGVSTDGSKAVYAFNPDVGNLPVWQVMERLKRGEALLGIVRDDTAVFAAAVKHGLAIVSIDVLVPNASFQDFQAVLAAEQRQSRFTYGFPDGNGDCNCITWLERIGLPLLTGALVNSASCLESSRLPVAASGNASNGAPHHDSHSTQHRRGRGPAWKAGHAVSPRSGLCAAHPDREGVRRCSRSAHPEWGMA